MLSVQQLADYIASISDVAIRADYVRHRLRELQPQQAADLLAILEELDSPIDSNFGKLRLAVALALMPREADPLCDSIRASAVDRGHYPVVEMLRRDASSAEQASRLPNLGKGKPLTLGERKTLARTRNREVLLRMMRDPHPDVVRIFLGNPTVTEDDVIRLASTRPVDPEILREIATNPRWTVRARVRKSIVLNPNAPHDVVRHLIALLGLHEKQELASSPGVSDLIVAACRRTRPSKH